MAEKFFLVNPKVSFSSKEESAKREQAEMDVTAKFWDERDALAEKAMQEDCNLKHTQGRVVVKVNMEFKNTHKFSNGLVIRRERQFNEFNRRITQPTNAVVVSAEGIPKGADILINHNSLHDTNKLFDYDSGSSDVKYFSIRENECYAWRVGKEKYQPLKNFEFGLRVFKPYEGKLVGIQPKILTDVLYVVTGDLSGLVVRTAKAADYQIIYQGDDGREDNLIRFRHSIDENFDREEIVGIANDLTEMAKDGQLLIGLSPHDAKKIFEL